MRELCPYPTAITTGVLKPPSAMETAAPSLLCALTALGLRLVDGRFTAAGAVEAPRGLRRPPWGAGSWGNHGKSENMDDPWMSHG